MIFFNKLNARNNVMQWFSLPSYIWLYQFEILGISDSDVKYFYIAFKNKGKNFVVKKYPSDIDHLKRYMYLYLMTFFSDNVICVTSIFNYNKIKDNMWKCFNWHNLFYVIWKTKIKSKGVCSKSYDIVLKQYIFLSIMHLCINFGTFEWL